MPVQTRRAAWAAAGIFAVGGVTGLAAPQLLRTAAPAVERTSNVSLPADSPTHGPIPLGVAPNYRAIVDQNQAAVVGIVDSISLADGSTFELGPSGERIPTP